MKHEVAHVRGCHSLDNIFVELLFVFLWFHPGLYWAKNAIKLNHEFLADQAVLQIVPIDDYKNVLLSMIFPDQGLTLISSLKFSLTKKRMNMMKRKTTLSTKLIKIVALIPIFGVMIYFFSEKVPAQNQTQQSRTISFNSEVEERQVSDLEIYIKPDGKIVIDEKTYRQAEVNDVLDRIRMANDLSTINLNVDNGTPMGEISDMQKLLLEKGVHHIEVNILGKSGEVTNPIQDIDKATFYKDVTFKVVRKDGTESTKTFEELSEDQKARLMPPPTIPEKKTPSAALFSDWQNPEKYAVWVDGKYTPAEQLKKIYRIHIVYYLKSYVHLNARSVKFPQEHQVSIYTEEGFEKTFGEESDFSKPKKGTITLRDQG
ncbi:hypothetical protein [Belliella marina]|uniref:hypothetical protein n=1 Tax=Belliella marina TaxID=1644146 RepID=UPI003670D29B